MNALQAPELRRAPSRSLSASQTLDHYKRELLAAQYREAVLPSRVEWMGRPERERTPVALALWLVALVRRCSPPMVPVAAGGVEVAVSVTPPLCLMGETTRGKTSAD